MSYAIVTVPTAAVRRKPSHRQEMVNQLLFGEPLRILKIKNERWLKVESLYDGYKGWLTHHLVTRVDEAEAKKPQELLTTDILSKLQFNGEKMWVPMGANLPAYENGHGKIGPNNYQFRGNVEKAATHHNNHLIANRIEALALNWLNAPYLWGGKTILGVDCSGFAQMVYKLADIHIRRDAWQQARQGQKIKKLSKAQKGDLAFFDDDDEIVHVGILLGPDRIIHASGNVRIDKIDPEGIINTDTLKRTHQLSVIRRFF